MAEAPAVPFLSRAELEALTAFKNRYDNLGVVQDGIYARFGWRVDEVTVKRLLFRRWLVDHGLLTGDTARGER